MLKHRHWTRSIDFPLSKTVFIRSSSSKTRKFCYGQYMNYRLVFSSFHKDRNYGAEKVKIRKRKNLIALQIYLLFGINRSEVSLYKPIALSTMLCLLVVRLLFSFRPSPHICATWRPQQRNISGVAYWVFL